MFILIVGCGRVGSSVARSDAAGGPRSLLPRRGPRVARAARGRAREELGGPRAASSPSAPALETDALVAAGIERADAFIASTDGDNTNIVIAQIAQRRYEVPTVIARILDPLRAEWYEHQGLHTVCPTRVAIDMLGSEVRAAAEKAERRRRAPARRPEDGEEADVYIIVVGAGKVGWNLARELLEKEHEVTLIESDRRRYLTVEQELEHNVPYGDASELWVLERAGIQRADMVIAVTGDDEDNMLICQVAREKYVVEPGHRPRQQPAQPPPLRPARDQAVGLGDRPDPAPDRARGARVRPRPPARPAGGAAGDHRDAARQGLRRHRATGSATCRCPRAAC